MASESVKIGLEEDRFFTVVKERDGLWVLRWRDASGWNITMEEIEDLYEFAKTGKVTRTQELPPEQAKALIDQWKEELAHES